MAMTKRTVGIIIILMIIALTGLIIIQVSLLNSSMALKEQTFQRNVLNALGSVAESLELQETVETAFDLAPDTPGGGEIAVFAKVLRDSNRDNQTAIELAGCLDTNIPTIQRTKEGFSYCVPSSQHIVLQVLDSAGRMDTTLIDQFTAPGIYHIKYFNEQLDSGRASFRMLANNIEQIIQTDNLDTVTNVGMITLDSSKTGFTMKVLNRLWDLEWRPIQERLDSLDLDSILGNRLWQAGIDLSYVYGVSSKMADSLVYGNREYTEKLLTSEFRTRLFPHDFLAPSDYLVLFFPESEAYLWKQMTPMLFSMILFLIIIISCFIFTVKTIIDQKRNAALMIDFVNNMTHEFKTPISTVALACEAILRSDVISDNDKVEQYSRLIRDENRRMRSQTEKILQMATLEEGDLEFKTEAVDLHAVIYEAMDNIALQIENRGGVIAASLKADDYFVMADKIHLENIIFNLLDNANKYSDERPDIMISTWNDKGQVFMQVEDHGKGISEENLKHIFKKYYRVPTGNIHDVKGFGLGLSYVKLMVEAHNGGISIKSKLGKGTRVVLFLSVLKV